MQRLSHYREKVEIILFWYEKNRWRDLVDSAMSVAWNLVIHTGTNSSKDCKPFQNHWYSF